jgi:hypothetical protein
MVPKKKIQDYTADAMREAMDDVQLNNLSIRGSAKLHNIPESTLRGRLSDPRGVNVRMGGPTIFTPNQEARLAQHCIYMADRGYGYARWQILEIAGNMSKAKGMNFKLTKHWFYGFLKRNPQVKMVNPKKREKVRSFITPAIVTSYFTELKQVLERYNLMNQSGKVWNVDESGISLDHTPPKVLSRCGYQPYSVTSGRSSTTTLVAAVSALGQTLPPYMIYKGQRLTEELICNGMEGSKFTTSPNGWVTSEIFIDFFRNHFLLHVTERPLILLYDGHATHVTLEIIDLASRSDVHLFVLPPHSSHLLQPLDVSIFSPFKNSLNLEMHKYMHDHPNNIITRQLLPGIINTAYKNSMSVQNIMSGFRKTGIFPFDAEIALPRPSTAELPTTVAATNQTRKERQDSRTITVLLQEKVKTFEHVKKGTDEPLKKKRKTCVPPFEAAITEQTFRDMIKERELEKQKTKPHTIDLNTEQPEPSKKKQKFQTPFCQPDSSGTDNATNTSSKSTKGKGKTKGKALAKKVKKSVTRTEDSDDEIEDRELCCICNKFQSDGLRLDMAISFVEWAQCDSCNGWVHLKYCSPVTKVSDNDTFHCRNCRKN